MSRVPATAGYFSKPSPTQSRDIGTRLSWDVKSQDRPRSARGQASQSSSPTNATIRAGDKRKAESDLASNTHKATKLEKTNPTSTDGKKRKAEESLTSTVSKAAKVEKEGVISTAAASKKRKSEEDLKTNTTKVNKTNAKSDAPSSAAGQVTKTTTTSTSTSKTTADASKSPVGLRENIPSKGPPPKGSFADIMARAAELQALVQKTGRQSPWAPAKKPLSRAERLEMMEAARGGKRKGPKRDYEAMKRRERLAAEEEERKKAERAAAAEKKKQQQKRVVSSARGRFVSAFGPGGFLLEGDETESDYGETRRASRKGANEAKAAKKTKKTKGGKGKAPGKAV